MSVRDDEASELRHALAHQLVARGDLCSPAWRAAVETVPRHLFLGDVIYREVDSATQTMGRPITCGGIDEAEWLRLAYTDETWVTPFDGPGLSTSMAGLLPGMSTSSSTLPSLVVRMLEDLQVQGGMRVLEIGTGTGYSTALLCERLGQELVTSVEIDSHIAARARASLRSAGYAPTLVNRDGLAGYPARAPYDRIVSTCSVRYIPPAWLTQARRGAVMLTTLSGWLHGSSLVRLTVTGPGTAEGIFLPGAISFMSARTHRSAFSCRLPPPGDHERSTAYGPDVLTDWTMRWIVQLAAPNARYLCITADDGTALECVHDDVSCSWSWFRSDASGGWRVSQGGTYRLWDRIEAALATWHAAGQPRQQDFRLSITPAGQIVSLPGSELLAVRLPSC